MLLKFLMNQNVKRIKERKLEKEKVRERFFIYHARERKEREREGVRDQYAHCKSMCIREKRRG